MSKQLLEKARLDLLDLGLRNNFINTRDSKNMSLRVIEESSLEVLKILVDKGYKMSFNSKKDVKEEDNVEFGALFELPPLESIDSDKLTDNILQTNHSDQDLQKRLRSVDRLSRLSIEVPKIFGFKVIKDDQKKIIESKISSLMRSKVIVSENEVLRILI
jgi:hypothetical protein